MTETKNLKWEVLARYKFIEIIALWEGRIVTNHLCNAFSIQRQQASKDIGQYQKLSDNNLIYDQKQKGYVPSKNFTPALSLGLVDEYIKLLESHESLDDYVERVEFNKRSPDSLHIPLRRADPEVVRSVINACKNGDRLELTYASMSNPTGEARIIAPHKIVNSGYRWHVRAFCEKNRDFRDFILGRIMDLPEVMSPRLEIADPSNDTDWNTQIEFNLVPNPSLSQEQQALIRFERNFPDNGYRITTRKALAIYHLQLLQVPSSKPSEQDGSIFANPVLLDDYRVIEDMQFGRS